MTEELKVLTNGTVTSTSEYTFEGHGEYRVEILKSADGEKPFSARCYVLSTEKTWQRIDSVEVKEESEDGASLQAASALALWVLSKHERPSGRPTRLDGRAPGTEPT